ncbi:MAG: cytidylate kinase-like family protein [Bacteroidales bacterium]|nr:cytidylate kinase-like family protein [Bacteroidales bacterium]
MENKNIIITINREFGTGGREIAHKLGNILGVKVYDKNVLDTDMGFDQNVTSKKMYQAEEKILKEIAAKESCVIVGRAGFHIFKDYPNAVKIFLIADFDARTKNLCEKLDLSESEARKMVKDIDERREKFTKKYTGVSRYDAHNYDFVINVTNIPTYHVAVFLAQNVRWKFQKNV